MRRILVTIITLTLLSCQEKTEYNLSGTAPGLADGTQLYLFEVDDSNSGVAKDTLVVNNGSFAATYPFRDAIQLQYLKVDGINGNVLFFVENEDLNAQIYKDSIGSSFVQGGKENELYKEYISTIRNFSQEKVALSQAFQKAQREQDGLLAENLKNQNMGLMAEEQEYKKSYIFDNKNSLFGLMLATELHSKGQLSGPEAEEVIAALSPKMKQHSLAIALEKRIASAKRAEIGGMAPEFSAKTPTGEDLALKDVLGKYTIIDFWASWCRPCRLENPNVVKVYEKYHEKGLNIISVSLDKPGQQDRWIQAIEDDNMNWYHVSNLQFWQDPIAEQYNVRSIPATFLLDSEGKIIGKNLRGPALEQRISQLLD